MIDVIILDLISKFRKPIITIICLGFILGCTENPFDEDNISKDDSRIISGIVSLDNDTDPSGVLIWLDKFNLFTFSDASGRYSFNLPEKSGEIGAGFTDFATIYYYVSNYGLDSSSIYIFNGSFKYGAADIDDDGIVKKINLKNIVTIQTIIDLDHLIANEYRELKGSINLTSPSGINTKTVTWLTQDGALTAFYFKSLNDPEEVYLSKRSVYLTSNYVSGSLTLTGIISLDSIPLNPGNYEVITYLRIDQSLPPGLLGFYNNYVTTFAKENLGLPVRRQNALLEIPGM